MPTKSDWRKARQYVQREYPSAHYTERGVVIAETLEIGNGSEPIAWLEAAERIRTHTVRCSWKTEVRIKSRVLRKVNQCQP